MKFEGEDKVTSYDKWWLRWDMESLGCMFEFCDRFAYRIYGVQGLDKLKVLNDFMVSNCRYEMETGYPKLLSQSAQDTFEDFINVDKNGKINQYLDSGVHYNFRERQLYWVGLAYAYIHYEADMLSRDIIQRPPIDYMLQQYYTGHEMDISVFYSKILPILQ